MMTKRRVMVAVVGLGLVAVGGCMERTGFLPNEDPTLRKPDKAFVADAVKRFPYKEDAPKGGKLGRAEVDYMYRYLGIANLSDMRLDGAEVWVNQQYVMAVPKWGPGVLKRIQFSMLRDERGNEFTTDGGRHPVKSVEVLVDGKMWEVPLYLADD